MTSSYVAHGSLLNRQESELRSLRAHSPRAVPLDDLNVLVITSGHEATDHRVYAKQACSIRQLGANVTVVATIKPGTVAQVRVLAVPTPSSRLTRFLWQPWRCLWTARRLDPDIIHFHDAEMLMTLPVAKLWWHRSKFVYDVHEDFANLMLVRDWLPLWAKPVARVLTNATEKGLALLADAIVGVTPPLAHKFPNREKVVAYNYISRDFFKRAAIVKRVPRDREFDLVHLGTLNIQRANFLARTVQEFHRLRPSARSLIIGAPPDAERILKDSIPDGCVILGETPHDEIPALLGNARVGLDVHPWLGRHLEVALPVKVCEYMAAGCAVVSSSMPVLDQILKEARADFETIRTIKGGEPVDYASSALQLVEAIEKGADPGDKLRELALKHMVWEKEAAKIVQLYLRLVKKHASLDHQC